MTFINISESQIDRECTEEVGFDDAPRNALAATARDEDDYEDASGVSISFQVNNCNPLPYG